MMVSLHCHYLTIELRVLPRKSINGNWVGREYAFFIGRDLYTCCNTNPTILLCK